MGARESYLIVLVSFLVLGVVRVCDADKGEGHDKGDGEGHGHGLRDGLKMKFYKDSCPQAEKIVKDITWNRARNDPLLGAKLLRLHYHDCFVRGCEASILLDGVEAEKSARPNLSLRGFEVIDEIKAELEKACPGTVSCADILALSARDSVSFPSKKPLWQVPTGRRDGTTSLASEVLGNLPSPFSNFTTLMQTISPKGLGVEDLVILSAAHTIGVAHCRSFSNRLYNFTGVGDSDPALDPDYAEFLKTKCPNPADPSTIVEMDPQSSTLFDNNYFDILFQNKGLFQSDAALLTDASAVQVAKRFQRSKYFFAEFEKAMKNMGRMDILVGNEGEIRKTCHAVNQ